VSHAYWNQGQAAKADEFAQIVEKSRAELSTYERVFLDYTEALFRGDREANLRTTRQLVAFTPKRQLAKYLNASAANRINYPREAVAVLSQYDPYHPAYQSWSRNYWGVLTTAHHMLENYKRELKEARRGRQQFPDSLLMLAYEVDALAALGRAKELQSLFDESKTLPPMRGYSPGDIMLRAGRELRAHGYREDSVRILNQALQWFESRSEQEKASAGYRYNQARTSYVLGNGPRRRRCSRDSRRMPGRHRLLGIYWRDRGPHGGQRRGGEGFQTARRRSKTLPPWKPTYWRARIAALLGDREGAVNLLRQATKEGFSYSSIHPRRISNPWPTTPLISR